MPIKFKSVPKKLLPLLINYTAISHSKYLAVLLGTIEESPIITLENQTNCTVNNAISSPNSNDLLIEK